VSESVTLIMQECQPNTSTCINLPIPITANGVSEASAIGN